jgi:hypothetical protein
MMIDRIKRDRVDGNRWSNNRGWWWVGNRDVVGFEISRVFGTAGRRQTKRWCLNYDIKHDKCNRFGLMIGLWLRFDECEET